MFGREFQAGEHRQHVLPPSPTRYAFERAENQRLTASRKQARPSESDLLSIVKGIAVSVGFSNARSMKNSDGSYFASLGQDYELFVTPTGRGGGYDWTVERKGSGVVREGWGMTSQEIVEDIRGSGVVASRKTAGEGDWFIGGGEAQMTYDGLGDGEIAFFSIDQTDEGDHYDFMLHMEIEGSEGESVLNETHPLNAYSLEEAIREAEPVITDTIGMDPFMYSSRKEAAQRTAFLDGFEVPEVRHRVAGWDWDDHLNGFLAAEAAREFTCSCGANVPAPGYTDCHCGKRWNCYQVQANGSVKLIAREVPVRDGVVMAGRTASRKQAADASYEGWTARVIYDEDGFEYAETTTPSGESADSIYPMDGSRFESGELREAFEELAREWGDDAYSGTYQYNSHRQAESGVPKFREGDMVIGRGPDMDTHTLREVGSVVEQDGGYFYRLRKLNGSGPGGSRLYAEEHLEGYKLQR